MSKIHYIKCEFLDEETEEIYRHSTFDDSKQQTTIGILIVAIAMLYFSRQDAKYVDDGIIVDQLLYLRIAYTSISLIILAIYIKTKLYEMADIIIFIWILFTAIVITFINISRSQEFTYHHIIDILLVMSFYIFFSNRFVYQIIPAMLFSITSIILFWNLEVISITEVNTVTFAHFCANFMGIYLSYNSHNDKRKMYLLLSEKEQL